LNAKGAKVSQKAQKKIFLKVLFCGFCAVFALFAFKRVFAASACPSSANSY